MLLAPSVIAVRHTPVWLYFGSELGPVVWPAYTDTSVGVRSKTLTIDLARLDEPEVRNKLAQAVLMADRAVVDAEAPELTADAAETHAEGSDDTPPITAEEAAERHESATAHYVRGFLAEVRAINEQAESTKELYSR